MTHANVLWNVARRLWGADCLIEAACWRAEHAVGADSPRADVGMFYGPHNKLRWDGEGWIGTDTNRLWLKSEGFSNLSRVSHGDRIASADNRFGQDENTHGRFPGGGSTVRFPREVGWGNAMRNMLTGDHWNAEEAYRIGEVQQIAPTPKKALEAGVLIANKIAACGPLGIETTLTSAHLSIDHTEEKALSKLDVQFGALFHT